MSKDKRSKYTKNDAVNRLYIRIETGDYSESLKNVKKKELKELLNFIFDDIREAVSQDKVVEFRNFGTLEVKKRKGRNNARNPKTGSLISIEGHGCVVFRPGKKLKKEVWNLKKSS